MAKKGLGKGLGAIFGEDVIKESEEEIAKAKAAVTDNGDGKSGELMVKMALIEPNREQPRKDFNEEQLAELADSIKRYGILQPLFYPVFGEAVDAKINRLDDIVYGKGRSRDFIFRNTPDVVGEEFPKGSNTLVHAIISIIHCQ